jgi:hypothetical protein
MGPCLSSRPSRPSRPHKPDTGDNYARAGKGPLAQACGAKCKGSAKVWLAPTLCAGALSLCRALCGACRAGVRTLVSDHPAILIRVRCPLGHPANSCAHSGNSRRYWAGAALLVAAEALHAAPGPAARAPRPPTRPPRPLGMGRARLALPTAHGVASASKMASDVDPASGRFTKLRSGGRHAARPDSSAPACASGAASPRAASRP